jgi:hypothetical protein
VKRKHERRFTELMTVPWMHEQADHWGWSSAATIALLVTALVLLAAWIRSEVRSTTPLVHMRMMRIPAVWTTNVVALLRCLPVSAFVSLPQFLQTPPSEGYGFGASYLFDLIPS